MKAIETEKFRDLLKTFDTVVLITHGQGRGPETPLRARPMVVAEVDDDCHLWFITGEDSAKVHEIDSDTRVHVICQKGKASCVSISGRASVQRDRTKIRELWKAAYRVWFPKGEDDPSIVLIRVTGEHAEYWDNTGVNQLSYAYRAVKALATGTTPEVTEGRQHGHVELAS